MRLLALVAVLAAGCSKPSENCSRSVKHILSLMESPGFKPSAEEQAAIDQVAKVTMERCDDEGLSDAQRDCILAATTLRDRSFLMCSALVAKKPSWLMAPIGHPEVIDEMDKLRNATP